MKEKIFLVILLSAILLITVALSGCTLSGQSGGVICHKVTKTVAGCDKIQGCTCLHKSWAGLGACDSCECEECAVGG
jgi:hypothetical protein